MRPAQRVLPRRVQQREPAVERDRRQQVAGHLEQPFYPARFRARVCRLAIAVALVPGRVGPSPSGLVRHLAGRRVDRAHPSPVGARTPFSGLVFTRWTNDLAAHFRPAPPAGLRRGADGRRGPLRGVWRAASLRRAPRRAGARPAPAPSPCASARVSTSPRRNRHTDRHIMIVMITALDTHSSQMAWIENTSR